MVSEKLSALIGTRPEIKPPDSAIKVGSKVKITGSIYATDGTIPPWVKSTTHVVSRIQGDSALLIVDKRTLTLPTRLTNQHLSQTELIRMIGIFSQDPDEEEILFSILQFKIAQPLPSMAANQGRIAVCDCPIDVTFENAEIAQIPVTSGFFMIRSNLDAHNEDQTSQPYFPAQLSNNRNIR